MKRIALAVWQNRISPLFDVAKRLLLVDIEDGAGCDDGEDLLFSGSLAGKVSRLCELKIDTLICGAISKELSLLLTSHGIQVIAFIAGDKDEVLSAYLEKGELPSGFFMPGCGVARIPRQRRSGRNSQTAFRSRRKAGGSKGGKHGKIRHQFTHGH